MTNKEIIEVVTAFENGEKIQYKFKNYIEYLDCTPDKMWDFVRYDYIIKPPIALRFLTINELWGKTLINKNNDMFIVNEFYTEHGYIGRGNHRYTIIDLHCRGWKLAGLDLNYETATRLEVES